MRLTLRTLLAYLDRILDEGDSQELERKIQESDIATQLVQRIQKSLKHRRSKAPAVLAEGLGSDANSVSEYLDNTLPAEKVPDFERVCLESDDHLAEVAACHQILTLVLGEPAEARVELKKRIYRLRDSAAAAATTPSSTPTRIVNGDARFRIDPGMAAASRAAAAPEIDQDERWTEAPDYLKRPQQRSWMPVALLALIAFGMAMAGLRGMGPFDRSHPLARRLGLVAAPPSQTTAVVPPTPNVESAARPNDARKISGPRSTTVANDLSPTRDLSDPATDESSIESQDQSADEPRAKLDGPNMDEITDDLAFDEAPLDASLKQDDAGILDIDGAQDFDEPNVPQPDDIAATGVQDNQVPTAAGQFASGSSDFEPLDLDAPIDSEVENTVGADDAVPPADAVSSNDPASSDNTAIDLAPTATEDMRDLDEPSLPADAIEDDMLADDILADGVLDRGASNPNRESGPPVEPPLPPTLINPLATNDTRSGSGPLETIPALPATRNGASAASPNDTATAVAEPEPPVITDVGRFLDDRQVLITYDEASDQWQRVLSGSRLQAGKRLMTLPTYRVPLSLASGVQVTLIGATRAELLPITDADESPVMRLEYGRMRVATFSQAGTSFMLRWGNDQTATIRLTDMETTFAIELSRQNLPGNVADADRPAYHVLHVHLLSGEAEWTTSDATPPIQLTSGKRLSLVDDGPAHLSDVTEPPAWVSGSDAKPRDPIAARDLAKFLTGDRPVTLVLREQADAKRGRRLDVSSLAACSLAQFNEFEPLIVALNDIDFRSYWSNQYEVLRDAPARSEEAAAALRRAIEQVHSAADAQQVLDLLRGIRPEQLAEGGGEHLIELLDHESCDIRVIASEMLRSITNLPSMYRANQNARQRRAAIARWRKHLEAGEVVYAQVPEVVRLLSTNPSEGDE